MSPQKLKNIGRPSVEPGGTGDEASAMTPLDPDHVSVLRVRFGLVTAALVALVAMNGRAFAALPVPGWLLPAAILMAGLVATLILPVRRYRGWGYREGEDEIEIRRGRLVRVRTIVPFGRVQHIDVAQGPIQRMFSLGTLILHTAGTRGASVPLPGLPVAEAEEMRDRIRAKIRQDLV
jgi:membrane protein YdbS with pleckstrin-like domain